jgi:glycosyltransferase involved in cell wall biosynthesis
VRQEEPNTNRLRREARDHLRPDAYAFRTVDQQDVCDYLRASDVFVLASLWEGQPRALIEAMAQGLPCVAHDHGAIRYVLAPGVVRLEELCSPRLSAPV